MSDECRMSNNESGVGGQLKQAADRDFQFNTMHYCNHRKFICVKDATFGSRAGILGGRKKSIIRLSLSNQTKKTNHAQKLFHNRLEKPG
jgi:hypothetical protein